MNGYPQLLTFLGSAFVLESVKPTGPLKQPIIHKPTKIMDIPNNTFKEIVKLDLNLEKYRYIYNEKELNTFKRLKEELKQHGRLEDSRTIENTALRWFKNKNEMLSGFGLSESRRYGVLEVFGSADGFKVLIPWSATGSNPCDECLDLDGELFSSDEFPAPPHYNCQCNDPMADPIILF